MFTKKIFKKVAIDRQFKNQLIVVNGEVLDKANKFTVSDIKPSDILAVNVLNPAEAFKKYGDKGKEGAIEIATKNRAVQKGEPSVFASPVIGRNSAKDTTGKSEVIFSQVQTPVEFPGGLSQWAKFLEKNLRADIPVTKGGPPGKYTVILSFLVDEKGKISDIKAGNNPGYGTKEEAIRVMKLSPNWIPAKQNGKNVICKQKQSLTFVVS